MTPSFRHKTRKKKGKKRSKISYAFVHPFDPFTKVEDVFLSYVRPVIRHPRLQYVAKRVQDT